MEIKSLKHNFIMYFIRAFSEFGFTLFIFPYIARKIGAEGVGQIQYIQTIVAYFLLFINFGVIFYGKREVALCRDDTVKLNNLVNELLTVLYFTTIIGSVCYFLFISFFIKNPLERFLLYIFFFNILLNLLNVEWFYLGIENQGYITKRNLAVKIISAISIFLFIKNKNDVYTYACILVAATVGSNIYNFINLRKYIKLQIKNYRDIKKHFKRLSYLFFSGIATSIAYNLDSIMIGKLVGDTELGYYTLASKFGKMPLVIGAVIFGIFSTRMTNMIGKKNKIQYGILWNLGKDIIFWFYFPFMVGIIILAKSLVLIIGGEEFIQAIPIFQLFSIYILIMGFAVLTGTTLDSYRRDKEYSISVILGAIFNFLFNIFFIVKLGAIGAVIATIITEIMAIIVRAILCRDIFKTLKLFDFNMVKLAFASAVMGLVVFHVEKLANNMFLKVGISTIIGGIVYTIILLLLKERLSWLVIEKVKSKVQVLATSK